MTDCPLARCSRCARRELVGLVAAVPPFTGPVLSGCGRASGRRAARCQNSRRLHPGVLPRKWLESYPAQPWAAGTPPQMRLLAWSQTSERMGQLPPRMHGLPDAHGPPGRVQTRQVSRSALGRPLQERRPWVSVCVRDPLAQQHWRRGREPLHRLRQARRRTSVSVRPPRLTSPPPSCHDHTAWSEGADQVVGEDVSLGRGFQAWAASSARSPRKVGRRSRTSVRYAHGSTSCSAQEAITE